MKLHPLAHHPAYVASVAFHTTGCASCFARSRFTASRIPAAKVTSSAKEKSGEEDGMPVAIGRRPPKDAVPVMVALAVGVGAGLVTVLMSVMVDVAETTVVPSPSAAAREGSCSWSSSVVR